MIALIAAMEIERDAIVTYMENVERKEINKISFVTGTIKGKETVVVLSGVGKVQAAIATTILLQNFTVDAIINIGTAGGLLKDQNVLDVVLSDRVVQHDFDTSPIDGEDGIGKYFDADERLIHVCKEVFDSMELSYHFGMVASGDVFINNDEQLARLYKYFPASNCAEMEAGAIAEVCSFFNVPFVVIRSLSDVAHKEASEMDFLTYAEKASKRSALFCSEVISKL